MSKNGRREEGSRFWTYFKFPEQWQDVLDYSIMQLIQKKGKQILKEVFCDYACAEGETRQTRGWLLQHSLHISRLADQARGTVSVY